MSDLFPPETRHAYGSGAPAARPRLREIAVYPYADEHGEILYEKVRYEPKTFRQRRLLPGGGYSWSLDGVRRVPFLLPEMLAKPDWPVLYVEGEKDALAAAGLGLLATTTTEGAGSGWDDDTYPPFFVGRRVAVLPDADAAGLAHARKVVGALVMGGAASVRCVRLPGAKDLSEWLAGGGTRRALVELVRAAPEWSAAP